MNDPKLIARLRDYLKESHNGRGQVDISTVATDLRTIYPEYGRRSYSAFKQRVVLAYEFLKFKQSQVAARQNPSDKTLGYCIDRGESKNKKAKTPLSPNQKPTAEASSNGKPTAVKRRKSPDSSGGDIIPPAFSEVVKPAAYPTLRLSDLGGLDHIQNDIERMLRLLRNVPLLKQLGAEPSRGLLLHGPPGCGKTSLAIALAGELDLPLLQTAGPELVAGISGQSEAQLRNLFKSASTRYRDTGCVLFIDELDVVAGRRESVSRDLERRLVSQLLLCIDGMPSSVLLIGATSRPDALDPGLRRTGRFDRELCLGQPGESEREDILRVITSSVKLAEDAKLASVARLTPGYVASDLKALVNAAAGVAVERYLAVHPDFNFSESLPEDDNKAISEQVESEDVIDVDELEEDVVVTEGNGENSEPIEIEATESSQDVQEVIETEAKFPSDLLVEYRDFLAAVKFVQPSAKREGFATVPDVNWSNVGSLEAVRYELFMAVVAPLHRPEIFTKLGLKGSPGILLFGPPGCGKTLLAKAVANESGLNFVAVNGPELLNMYVGESERAVRQVFARARASSPCLVFFDELDSLCPTRTSSASTSGSDSASSRVVNQMLCELDGVQSRGSQVFVLAATNRPDMVDPAVLRPGRFDKLLYVGLPDECGRLDILLALTKKATKPMISEKDQVLQRVAKETDGFTGADLSALVREAAVIAAGPLLKAVAASSGCVAKPPQYDRSNDVVDMPFSREVNETVVLEFAHFEKALRRCHRSVKPEDLRKYERLCARYTVAQPDMDQLFERQSEERNGTGSQNR